MINTVLDEKQILDKLHTTALEIGACLTAQLLTNRYALREYQFRNIYEILFNGYLKYEASARILKSRDYSVCMLLESVDSRQLDGMYVHLGTLHHLAENILDNSVLINKELLVKLEIQWPASIMTHKF